MSHQLGKCEVSTGGFVLFQKPSRNGRGNWAFFLKLFQVRLGREIAPSSNESFFRLEPGSSLRSARSGLCRFPEEQPYGIGHTIANVLRFASFFQSLDA